jgi:hypothetical protein
MGGFIGVCVVGYSLVFLAGVKAFVGRRREIQAMEDYDFPKDFSPELENVPLPTGEGVDELPN